MKKDDNVYLHHMLDAIARIEEYTKGISKEYFLGTGLCRTRLSGN